MYRLLKPLYDRLPIATRHKLALKNYVYTNFAPLFETSFGYIEWSKAREVPPPLPKAPPVEGPSEADWRRLMDLRASRPLPDHEAESPVVVVPVYLGHDETLACLYSVLNAELDTHLVVVDDASPDAALAERLAELAAAKHFRLERNASNQGFVATANTCMTLYPDRDVVLLNSDTQVFGDWLERLRRAAHSAPDIGTVTPLSNNGEICSYPNWLANNEDALELDHGRLDELAAVANRGRNVDAPTAVGFCMYLRRQCIDETGLFDPAFGRGYGEENDFCLRAKGLGWRNVIAGDVVVRHIGSVSFGADTHTLRETALGLMATRFPGYERDLAAFIQEDPVRPFRIDLDLARLVAAAPYTSPAKTLLLVTHGHGGGIERHVSDLCHRLEADGVNVYVLRPTNGASGPVLAISRSDVGPTPNVQFHTPDDHDLLVAALEKLGIDHVHIHSLDGYGLEAPDSFGSLCRDLQCRYDVTLHDYLAICPRTNLMGRDETYCGEPDVAGCKSCLHTLDSPFGRPSITDWRERWAELLSGARRVYCPSRDVLERVERYVPHATFALRPHPETSLTGSPAIVTRGPDEALRVAVIGAIGPNKGAGVLLACAKDAAARDLPIEFHLVGFSDRDDPLQRTGKVIQTGQYQETDLPALLAKLRCHLSFIPSVWPETYSYTLSAAFATGVFPVVFDLGAQAARIEEVGWGRVISRQLQHDASSLNDLLLGIDVAALPPMPGGRYRPTEYESLVRDYYEDFAG